MESVEDLYADCPGCTHTEQHPEFQKMMEITELGLEIYIHRAKAAYNIPDAGRSFRNLKLVHENNDIIFHNCTDANILPIDVLALLDPDKITCPRCQKMFENMQDILLTLPVINRNEIRGICNLCLAKLQSNVVCDQCREITEKFATTQGIQYKIQQLEKARTHSELNLQKLTLRPPLPKKDIDIQPLFHSDTKLDLSIYDRPIIKKVKQPVRKPSLAVEEEEEDETYEPIGVGFVEKPHILESSESSESSSNDDEDDEVAKEKQEKRRQKIISRRQRVKDRIVGPTISTPPRARRQAMVMNRQALGILKLPPAIEKPPEETEIKLPPKLFDFKLYQKDIPVVKPDTEKFIEQRFQDISKLQEVKSQYILPPEMKQSKSRTFEKEVSPLKEKEIYQKKAASATLGILKLYEKSKKPEQILPPLKVTPSIPGHLSETKPLEEVKSVFQYQFDSPPKKEVPPQISSGRLITETRLKLQKIKQFKVTTKIPEKIQKPLPRSKDHKFETEIEVIDDEVRRKSLIEREIKERDKTTRRRSSVKDEDKRRESKEDKTHMDDTGDTKILKEKTHETEDFVREELQATETESLLETTRRVKSEVLTEQTQTKPVKKHEKKDENKPQPKKSKLEKDEISKDKHDKRHSVETKTKLEEKEKLIKDDKKEEVPTTTDRGDTEPKVDIKKKLKKKIESSLKEIPIVQEVEKKTKEIRELIMLGGDQKIKEDTQAGKEDSIENLLGIIEGVKDEMVTKPQVLTTLTKAGIVRYKGLKQEISKSLKSKLVSRQDLITVLSKTGIVKGKSDMKEVLKSLKGDVVSKQELIKVLSKPGIVKDKHHMKEMMNSLGAEMVSKEKLLPTLSKAAIIKSDDDKRVPTSLKEKEGKDDEIKGATKSETQIKQEETIDGSKHKKDEISKQEEKETLEIDKKHGEEKQKIDETETIKTEEDKALSPDELQENLIQFLKKQEDLKQKQIEQEELSRHAAKKKKKSLKKRKSLKEDHGVDELKRKPEVIPQEEEEDIDEISEQAEDGDISAARQTEKMRKSSKRISSVDFDSSGKRIEKKRRSSKRITAADDDRSPKRSEKKRKSSKRISVSATTPQQTERKKRKKSRAKVDSAILDALGLKKQITQQKKEKQPISPSKTRAKVKKTERKVKKYPTESIFDDKRKDRRRLTIKAIEALFRKSVGDITLDESVISDLGGTFPSQDHQDILMQIKLAEFQKEREHEEQMNKIKEGLMGKVDAKQLSARIKEKFQEKRLKDLEKLKALEDEQITKDKKGKKREKSMSPKTRAVKIIMPSFKITSKKLKYIRRLMKAHIPAYRFPLKREVIDTDEIGDIIIGEKIYNISKPYIETYKEKVPIVFKAHYDEDMLTPITIEKEPKPSEEKIDPLKEMSSKMLECFSGYISYRLSDPSFIQNGWTTLPTERVVRKMTVFRMHLPSPEADWFEFNMQRGETWFYPTGEKLAHFYHNGCGQWYYKNGKLALDYYEAREEGLKRYVIYSDGEPDERGRTYPVTILAAFDRLGNGIVFDHIGEIRLKYNQTEGLVLDKGIGPLTHWKWHSLNDPPEMMSMYVEKKLSHKDPEISKIGAHIIKNCELHNNKKHMIEYLRRSDGKYCDHDTKKQEDNEMLAIEFENFVKDKAKKDKKNFTNSQSYKKFEITMKTLKINKNFSLKILDQKTIRLQFRVCSTILKLNLGLVLDHRDVVDTDIIDAETIVFNSLERYPATSPSILELQKARDQSRRVQRARIAHELRLSGKR